MGNAIIKTGGVGADSDELTAYKQHVLEGHTAITHDSDGDPITGTMPLRAIYNAMPNVDDIGKDSTGLYSRIPYGYYPERGSKTGYSYNYLNDSALASAIGLNSSLLKNGANILGVPGDAWTVWTGDVTAEDSHVLSGKTYWKQGAKRTGNLSIQSVVSFNVAQYSTLTLIASWAYPSKGPWSGLRIMCKLGGYPANVNDGTLFYEGSGPSATKKLSTGTWYFRAWNYITTNHGRLYGNYHSATAVNNEIKGQQVFTSSGVFTVPTNVRSVDAFCVGGGGGVTQVTNNCSGGGGGGYTKTLKSIAVTPGQQIYVTVGAGGQARSSYDDYMGNIVTTGSASSFGTYVTANGGNGGYEIGGGAGGSGGGERGHESGNDDRDWAGDGGSDGSNGYLKGQYGSTPPTGAAGQHTTTRAFGEASGTLYSGGGGGGTSDKYTVGTGGAGGGGDGAGRNYNKPVSGTPGTGGGGGGTFWRGEEGDHPQQYSYGGSGIVIVRWGY